MINKLIANIKKTGAPIVVGLDPMLKLYSEADPGSCIQEFERRWKVLQKQSGSTIKELWMPHMI